LKDLPLLCDFFLRQYARKYNKPVDKLGTAARKMLERYDWPGNVRELQHSLERAVIMSGTPTLRADDFVLSSVDTPGKKIKLDDFNLEQVEKQVIARVLRKHGGNVSQAARELGLTRASLYRRLQKHGL
jgi:transcriptional regulator with PAS, ATPase and Fis domain